MDHQQEERQQRQQWQRQEQHQLIVDTNDGNHLADDDKHRSQVDACDDAHHNPLVQEIVSHEQAHAHDEQRPCRSRRRRSQKRQNTAANWSGSSNLRILLLMLFHLCSVRNQQRQLRSTHDSPHQSSVFVMAAEPRRNLRSRPAGSSNNNNLSSSVGVLNHSIESTTSRTAETATATITSQQSSELDNVSDDIQDKAYHSKQQKQQHQQQKHHLMADNLRHCSLDGDFLELFHHHVCYEMSLQPIENLQSLHADPHEYFTSQFGHGDEESPTEHNADAFQQQQRHLRSPTSSSSSSSQNAPKLHGPCAAQFFTQLLTELQDAAQRLFHEEATLLTLQTGMCNRLHQEHGETQKNDAEDRTARARWLQHQWEEV